jgi:hypothetical protein
MERKMLKAWGPAVAAGSIWCAVQTATGPPVAAFDRHIQITNNTRMAIIEFYVAPVGTELWEKDLLGDEILLPANSVLVDVNDRTGYCRFDVKVIYDDGTGVIRHDVNICRGQGYAISYR